MKIIIKITKVFITTICIFTLSACAGPVTDPISISKEELRKEEKMQKELYNRSQQKQKDGNSYKKAKHDKKYYEARLFTVSKRCQDGMQKMYPRAPRYKFIIKDDPILNAWADGKNIYVTPVMMDFLASDIELATILSHELSHNVMGHIGKKTQNMIGGLLLDVAAAVILEANTQGAFSSVGSGAFSKDFENEADYVGVYIMANSGYKVDGIGDIWRKMAVTEPSGSRESFFSTHPSHSARYLRLNKIAKEIKDKKAKNLALLPNIN